MSSQSSSVNPEPSHIPLLKDDGSNFAAWKVRTETILKVKGLYGAIDGTETDPVKLQIAQTQLVFTVEDGPLHVVVEANGPKEMWDRLCVRYEVKSIRKPVFLVRDLFRSTLDDRKPLMPQIQNLRQIARVLETLNQPISKNLIAMAIINSLPPSYSVVQTILMAEDPGPPSVNEVITRVLVEESRREQLKIQPAHTDRHARDGRRMRGATVRKEECDTCGKRHGGECRLLSQGQNDGTSATSGTTNTNTSSQGVRNTNTSQGVRNTNTSQEVRNTSTPSQGMRNNTNTPSQGVRNNTNTPSQGMRNSTNTPSQGMRNTNTSSQGMRNT